MRIRVAFATALTMVPAAAFAHPGHLSGLGFADGFLHPLSGADHLAAALLVGALAAVSRRAHATPVAFLAAAAAGLLIGGAPHAAWIAELGIVLGFAALAGAILVRRAAAWMLPAAAAVAGAAHGLAHGSQASGATAYAAGVLAATAALAGAGYLGARWPAGWRRTGGSAQS